MKTRLYPFAVVIFVFIFLWQKVGWAYPREHHNLRPQATMEKKQAQAGPLSAIDEILMKVEADVDKLLGDLHLTATGVVSVSEMVKHYVGNTDRKKFLRAILTQKIRVLLKHRGFTPQNGDDDNADTWELPNWVVKILTRSVLEKAEETASGSI